MYIYIYISVNKTYREICFASIMQASAKPCRVFSFFFFSSCFSCLHQPNLRSPSYMMIMPAHDWSLSAWRDYLAFRCNLSLVHVVLVFSSDIGTELVTIESTIETTRRGGSSMYRRKCHTLLYLLVYFACELRPSGSPQPFVY